MKAVGEIHGGKKRCLNCHVYGCKALRESPQVRRGIHHIMACSLLRGGSRLCVCVWLCGWKVGPPSWKFYLFLNYFLDCATGDMVVCVLTGGGGGGGVSSVWLGLPGCFAYRDSMEAQAPFKSTVEN